MVDDLKELGVDMHQALVRDTTTIRNMIRTGELHPVVRLAKVENARHPSKLVANSVSDDQETYVCLRSCGSWCASRTTGWFGADWFRIRGLERWVV